MEKQAVNIVVFSFAETDHVWFGSAASLSQLSGTGLLSRVSPLTFRVLKHHFERV